MNPTRIGAFVSIPRNASNTVRRVLELGENRDRDNTDSPVIHENHQRLPVLAEHHDLSGLLVFCFVRNPYDRVVSWYAYHRHLEPYCSLAFTDWIAHGMPHHWQIQNGSDYRNSGLTPLRQTDFMSGGDVGFIGRVERFSFDCLKLVDQLNRRAGQAGLSLRYRFREQVDNASKREADWRACYDTQSMARVGELLAEDFRVLGYEREA